MKKYFLKINLRLWFFTFPAILFSNALLANYNIVPETIRTVLEKYIPSHYEIIEMAEGKLNQDNLTDYALIIRHSKIRDSLFLLILFQKSPMIFEEALKLENHVSENDNKIWITDDGIFHIETIIPWNGINDDTYDIKFINNQWFYVGHTSSAFEPGDSWANNWSNSVNFITGEFKIRHEITYKENKPHIRETSGFIDKIGPIPIHDDCSNYMVTKYKGETITIFGRCDLWNYAEIEKLSK